MIPWVILLIEWKLVLIFAISFLAIIITFGKIADSIDEWPLWPGSGMDED